MTDNYDVVFQMTKACERSVGKRNPFTEKDMNNLIKYAVSKHENGEEGKRVVKFPWLNWAAYAPESTMYIVRLSGVKRAIISIDADEIFDQLIITMWGLVSNADELKRVTKGIQESVFQEFLSSAREEDSDEQ